METNIILTKQSNDSDLKRYFLALQEISHSGDEFPVDLDDVWMLVYARKDKAVEALIKDGYYTQGSDYQVFHQNGENSKGGRPTNKYYLSLPCLEYFIVRRVRAVFEVYRQVFHKVVEAQSLPSYQEEDPIKRAELWIVEQKEKRQLSLENKQQAEKIEEQSQTIEKQENEITELNSTVEKMQSKVNYLDKILASKSIVKVELIASAYGTTAYFLNKALFIWDVQHPSGSTWNLYREHQSKGYTHMDTFSFSKGDGSLGTAMTMKWTQRGRLFLYDFLKAKGFLPHIELPEDAERRDYIRDFVKEYEDEHGKVCIHTKK